VIRPEIVTDPEQIFTIGADYLRSVLPGWAPNDADGLTWTLRAAARMAAEVRDMAAEAPLEDILRPIAEKVHRIAPQLAYPATVAAKVTMRDRAGYTVPAGMEVLVKTSGDDGVVFAAIEPVTVDPDVDPPVATVQLRAMPGREGAAGNGLDSSNEAVVIRSFEFIDSIVLEGVSSGGADAESDDDYLVRASDELALASAVPILLPDFAALARRHPAVARALALHQTLDEIIEVTGSSGTAAGTLTDRASARSVTLTAGMTASALASAFAALTPAGSGYTASATGGPLGTAPIVVTLKGRPSYGPWQIASTVSGQSVTVAETQRGGSDNPVPRKVSIAVHDVNGLALGSTAKAEVAAMLEAMREVNFALDVIDPTITAIDVTFTAVAVTDWDPDTVRAAAIAALQRYLSPATWGAPAEGEQPGWVDEPVVRFLEVAAVLNAVPGLRWVTDLRIGLEGRTLGAADVTLPGPAALPRPGAGITGTVTEA